MNIQGEIKEGVYCVEVDGEMTVYKAEQIKHDLDMCFDADASAIDINLVQVTEIDTAGMQCLIMVRRKADQLEKKLRYVGRSDAVKEAVEMFGLAHYFSDVAQATTPLSINDGL